MMKSLVSVIAKLRRNENGAILVITAAALVIMLGMTAMVVDIGALALEKTRLQSACDAAALAAAWQLPDAFSARQMARDYLEMNNVNTSEAIISFNTDNTKVFVKASRNIDFRFARVLGINHGVATAKAAAMYGSIKGMTGVVPFGIPDQELAFGEEYQLKAGSHDDYGPGNYGPLALELRGASSYLNNLKYGYDGILSVGDWVETEPGNMSGPTFDGVTYRLNSCTHTPECSINSYHSKCPTVMIVPIYEPASLSGRTKVKIVGFGAFLLKGVSGKGNNSKVTGYFLEIVPPDGLEYILDPNQNDYGLRTAKLVSE